MAYSLVSVCLVRASAPHLSVTQVYVPLEHWLREAIHKKKGSVTGLELYYIVSLWFDKASIELFLLIVQINHDQ